MHEYKGIKLTEITESMNMHRTKILTANGYSLEASFNFNEETNVLDMDVNMTTGMHVNIEYNEGKYVVVKTKYIPQEYVGTWENMPEFHKWLDDSSMMRVLYGFYSQHRTDLTDIEHDTIVALLEA